MAAQPPGFTAKISIKGRFLGSGILVRPDLLRLPHATEGAEIPGWSESVAAGSQCEYFAFPSGSYKWGQATVRAEHSDHLEIEIVIRSGASGGALTRSREGRLKYVGLIDQGEATVSLAINKAAVEAFLQAQDTSRYLSILRGEMRLIELRDIGGDVSDRKRQPAMEELYHPLKTPAGAPGRQSGRAKKPSADHLKARTAVPLEKALRNKRLIVEGGPGSGKTTFLRRIAWALCREDRENETLQLPFDGFPLWIRIRDLDEHMTAARAAGQPAPTTFADPEWLTHFFAFGPARLDRRFAEARFADGNSVLLIDGLDEAGSTERREQIARMIESAAAASKCRYVVSTRPGGTAGKAALPGFQTVVVADWELPETEAFCLRWSRWLKGNPVAAEEHARGLAEAVSATPRQLRANPLMLTALAVIYRPDTRLPDERALLYEAIMNWLAKKAEEHARDRSSPAAGYTREECLKRLGRLAIEMQNWKNGLTLRAGIEDAARRIEGEFRTVPEEDRFEAARAFLEEAQVKSGIVTLRGKEIEFWHRSFQEYLAARRLKGFGEQERLAPQFSGVPGGAAAEGVRRTGTAGPGPRFSLFAGRTGGAAFVCRQHEPGRKRSAR